MISTQGSVGIYLYAAEGDSTVIQPNIRTQKFLFCVRFFVVRPSRGRLRQSIFSHSAQKNSLSGHTSTCPGRDFYFCRFFRFLRFLSSSSQSHEQPPSCFVIFMIGRTSYQVLSIASTFTAAVRARLPASPPAASANAAVWVPKPSPTPI